MTRDRKELEPKSSRFSSRGSRRFNIVAISCIQLPPYSAGSRHITRNFHSLLCGLPRTVSAKTTPIKVDDLNRGAYGRDGRATETSNTPYDPAKRLEIFRRTPPTIPSFPLRSLIDRTTTNNSTPRESLSS